MKIISNHIKIIYSIYFGIQILGFLIKGRFSPSSPFPQKNMKKDPPDNISYSVHIAPLNIFPKPGLMRVSRLVIIYLQAD